MMAYDKNNIFAKILRKEIPANPVFENELVLAFEDISPKAPVHILIIPKAEVATVQELTADHDQHLLAMFAAARQIAAAKGLAEDGYRLVINCQEGGGQEVFHLHMHLLGGRTLQWPPG
jgi:histidine triad (HIT) family protein